MEAFEIQGVIFSTAATNNVKYDERLENGNGIQLRCISSFQFEFEEADAKMYV